MTMFHKYLGTLILLTVFKHYVGGTCTLVDGFYPFGNCTVDERLPEGDDNETGNVQLTTPFLFYGNPYQNVYVKINGIITFSDQYTSPNPQNFPVNGQVIIAPFWADVETATSGGSIWYRQVRSTETDTLQRASWEVRNIFPWFYNFQATTVFIATYHDVSYLDQQVAPANYERNTFQTVLISNETESVVVFLYNKIEWSRKSATHSHAQVGFNGGNGNYVSLPTSIPALSSGDIINMAASSNVNVTGKWIFRVDGNTVAVDEATNAAASASGISCNVTNETLPVGSFSTLNVTSGIYMWGQEISFTCEVGYYSTGIYPNYDATGTLKCMADETWAFTSVSSCMRRSCGPPQLNNNTVKTSGGMLYKDTITIQCADGYKVTSGDNTTTCQADSTWNGTALQCQKLSCGDPGLVDNAVRTGSSYLYEDVVSYTCNEGYERRWGSPAITCQGTGLWFTPKLVCQKKRCPIPSVTTGTVRTGNNAFYEFGDVITFACEPGYEYLSGSYSMECLSNTTWNGSHALQCQRKNCGDPGINEHAFRTGDDNFLYGAKLNYGCKPGFGALGFGLEGEADITCTENGTWSSTRPVCIILERERKTKEIELKVILATTIPVAFLLFCFVILVCYLTFKKKRIKQITFPEEQKPPSPEQYWTRPPDATSTV